MPVLNFVPLQEMKDVRSANDLKGGDLVQFLNPCGSGTLIGMYINTIFPVSWFGVTSKALEVIVVLDSDVESNWCVKPTYPAIDVSNLVEISVECQNALRLDKNHLSKKEHYNIYRDLAYTNPTFWLCVKHANKSGEIKIGYFGVSRDNLGEFGEETPDKLVGKSRKLDLNKLICLGPVAIVPTRRNF